MGEAAGLNNCNYTFSVPIYAFDSKAANEIQ
ncbi:hypothetical protein STAN_5683 [Streptomyces sp. CBMAI 2042]|nr:hypothetical protein STAN_5683 [Streptomyces sp. CBMAI 2042]